MRLLLVTLAFAASVPAAGQTIQNDGSLNYSFVVPLPRARGRHQPSLTLRYNNLSQGDGTLGVGWVMDHMYIEQGTRASLDAGGNHRTPLWLVRGASRVLLVPVPGYAGTFRPEVDTRYTVVSQSGSDYTLVDDQGTRYSFHQFTGDTGKNTPNRWYLVSVQDVDNNTAQYTYLSQDGSTTAPPSPLANGALLSRIDYDNSGTSQWAHSVVLTAIPATWSMTQATAGALINQGRLFSVIAVSGIVGGYQYKLSYEYETPNAGRARLINIVRQDASGTMSLDAGTSFSYTPVGALNRPQTASATLTLSDPASLLAPCGADCAFKYGFWIDLDNDGRPDLVWQNPSGVAWARNISQTDNPQLSPAAEIAGSAAGAASTTGQTLTWSSISSRNGILRDFNGDGFPDLVYDDASCPNTNGALAFAVAFGQVNPGSHEFYFASRICVDVTNVYHDWALTRQSTLPGFCVLCGDTAVLYDLDGDGVADLYLKNYAGGWVMHRGYFNGYSWAFLSNGVEVFVDPPTTAAPDFNGDGLGDTVRQSQMILNAGGGQFASFQAPYPPVPDGTFALYNGTFAYGYNYFSYHPFVDLISQGGLTAHRNYGMGVFYGPAPYDEPVANIPAFTSSAGYSYPAVPVTVDIDGDGFPDALSAYNQGQNRYFASFRTMPESWLQQIATPNGAVINVGYQPFQRTLGSAREPAWVVYVVTTTGPGMAMQRTWYSYSNMRAPLQSWDDPQRPEPLGFADTYAQDNTTLQVVHTIWGGDHLTARKPVSVSMGTASALFTGVPSGPVQYYMTTQHRYRAKPIGASACLASTPSQLSTTQSLNGYPVILVDTVMSVATELGSMSTVTGSADPANPDCSSVDDAGNQAYVASLAESTRSVPESGGRHGSLQVLSSSIVDDGRDRK